MTLIWGSCPLYSAPKACSPSPFLSPYMCVLLLHYLRWCIHWKWPYTSVNMSSHRWWHPKSLTSTPSPHFGTPQHPWAALRLLWWLSIILDNVSQWQSRHHSKVIFTPTVGHVHVKGRVCDEEGVEALSSTGWLTPHLFLSPTFAPLVLKKRHQEQKGHCTLSHFLKEVSLPLG